MMLERGAQLQFITYIAILILGGTVAQAKDIPNLGEEVRSRLKADPNSAYEWINSLGTPQEVCDIYNKVVREL